MADVLFSGGPCSGKHEHVSDAAVADGRLSCGGMNYRVYPVGGTGAPDEYLALPPNVAAPLGAVATAKQASPAFQGMLHALTRSGPAELRRAQAERRALLRIGRR